MEDVIIFTDGGIWVGYFDAERLESERDNLRIIIEELENKKE